ncbi:hypothetical protein V8E54_013842, partial [Elaphomyces granulatus]
MFFARTQIHHDWKSPEYGFTPRQRQTWQALWRLAGSQVRDQGQTADADQRQEVTPDESSLQLSRIQVACLEACIELLNQSAQGHEYECALVCALSILGIRESEGWRDTEDYHQILSRMIKIARFMVVVKAIRLDPNAYDCVTCLGEQREDLPWDGPMAVEGYTFEGSQDAGYESNPGTPTPEPPASIPALSRSNRHRDANPRDEITGNQRSFREWLGIFMDTFMVRGTHSPMQWMLDLRTYGLKIHYNTTSLGHIEWRGPDELLYKQINFTMGDFRGFVHGLVRDTRRILQEDLLFRNQQGAAPIPPVPWLSMCDDPS